MRQISLYWASASRSCQTKQLFISLLILFRLLCCIVQPAKHLALFFHIWPTVVVAVITVVVAVVTSAGHLHLHMRIACSTLHLIKLVCNAKLAGKCSQKAAERTKVVAGKRKGVINRMCVAYVNEKKKERGVKKGERGQGK